MLPWHMSCLFSLDHSVTVNVSICKINNIYTHKRVGVFYRDHQCLLHVFGCDCDNQSATYREEGSRPYLTIATESALSENRDLYDANVGSWLPIIIGLQRRVETSPYYGITRFQYRLDLQLSWLMLRP